MDATAELKSILERLDAGEPGARSEAERFLGRCTSAELVRMEEELVARGMPLQRMKGLCASHVAARRAGTRRCAPRFPTSTRSRP